MSKIFYFKNKTALLISGHMRSINYNIESLTELKKKINADIFIHTWNTSEMKEDSWHVRGNYHETEKNFFKYIDLLNPSEILIEDADEVKESICELFNLQPTIVKKINGFYYQYYAIIKAFEIFENYCRKNKKRFQTLIRYRFDLCPGDINALAENILDSYVKDICYVSQHSWASITGTKSDCIFVSSFKNYQTLVKNLKRNLSFKKYQKLCNYLPPEIIFSASLSSIKEKIKLINTPIFLIRTNGKKEMHSVKNKNYFVYQFKSLLKVILFFLKLLKNLF